MKTRDKNIMGYFRKKLERRTFSQDRYYTLIKRKKLGQASFHDLEELDEIVNRVPDIREQVILENFYGEEDDGSNTPPNNPIDIKPQPHQHKNLLDVLQSFFHRLFAIEETGHNATSLL